MWQRPRRAVDLPARPGGPGIGGTQNPAVPRESMNWIKGGSPALIIIGVVGLNLLGAEA
jgi:hypothetical protein